MTKLECYEKAFFIIDENRKIESGVSGFDSKEEAEQVKNELIKSRSKKGQKYLNREFGRSKKLEVVEGQRRIKC